MDVDAELVLSRQQIANGVRERFGMGQFWQACLLARRLVEAGVR
ncbi:MAG: hypothetical protein ACPGFB_05325 [Verrucomicrobiales bacterium]